MSAPLKFVSFMRSTYRHMMDGLPVWQYWVTDYVTGHKFHIINKSQGNNINQTTKHYYITSMGHFFIKYWTLYQPGNTVHEASTQNPKHALGERQLPSAWVAGAFSYWEGPELNGSKYGRPMATSHRPGCEWIKEHSIACVYVPANYLATTSSCSERLQLAVLPLKVNHHSPTKNRHSHLYWILAGEGYWYLWPCGGTIYFLGMGHSSISHAPLP